jgi:hypothetical protein
MWVGLMPISRGQKRTKSGQSWWYTLRILALKRLKQEDVELEASLGYIGKPCLKRQTREREQSLTSPEQEGILLAHLNCKSP